MAALLRRGLATGAPAPAVGPSGTAAAAPPEPPLRPEPPPPPPEGFTGVFVAGDAAVTAGAAATGEFNEVGLRGDAVRDLRGSFEIGEMDSLATASSSSLQLSATISLPSRDAAEAAAGWLESAAPGTIAEAVGLHCPPSLPAFTARPLLTQLCPFTLALALALTPPSPLLASSPPHPQPRPFRAAPPTPSPFRPSPLFSSPNPNPNQDCSTDLVASWATGQSEQCCVLASAAAHAAAEFSQGSKAVSLCAAGSHAGGCASPKINPKPTARREAPRRRARRA